MKKTIIAALFCLSLVSYAQAPTGVPMSVYILENESGIPAGTSDLLTNRLKASVANAGMGATDDVRQFFISARAVCLDKNIITGAPTKYLQTSELTIYVIDAFAKREFCSLTLECKGVGNSEQQAFSNSIKDFKATNERLIAFIKESNKNILDYYNSQYRNIIAGAKALAVNHSYEEALFYLSCIPQACTGYQEAVDAALTIYKQYLDYQSYQALAKARTIWNAGQDFAAAEEAGQYIAMVDPESKYYNDAVALNNEIKQRINNDIDYYRKIEQRDADYGHEERMSSIEAWKSVGVAYGNGQKTNYYKSWW